jgi:hypothetical protein
MSMGERLTLVLLLISSPTDALLLLIDNIRSCQWGSVLVHLCQPRFCHTDSTVPATVCLRMRLLPYLFGTVM